MRSIDELVHTIICDDKQGCSVHLPVCTAAAAASVKPHLRFHHHST